MPPAALEAERLKCSCILCLPPPARPRTRRAQWNQSLQLAARVGASGGLEGTVFLELYDENTFKDAHVGTATLNLQARAGRSPAAAPLLAPFS